MMRTRRLLFPVLVVLAALLAGCSGGVVAEDAGDDPQQKRRAAQGKIGGSGLDGIFGDEPGAATSGSGIAVNSFLWRASLDTISFMPLSQADPFGGVIITDWYSAAESPNTRFKLNVFILGRELRADGLRASVFKQNRTTTGQWVDVPVGEETVSSLENAILAKAREMRIAAAAIE